MPRLPRSRLARDIALGTAFAAIAEIELMLLDPVDVDGALVGHHLLNLLIVPAVALRRISFVGSIAAVSAGFAVEPVMGSAPVATPYLVVLFLLASLGWYAPLRTGAALVALVLVCGIGVDAATHDFRWADAVVNAVIIIAAWAATHVLRRATDRRVRAEVEADRAARAAVDAERTRIAQDLHDSLAHALTLMVLQAGSARERTADPAVVEAFASIEHGGRTALADMHRFLGLLGPKHGEAPGIADIEDLVDAVRRSGIQVELDLDHRVAEALAPSAATTVYRVVQEGLTNVVRHSDARTAQVVVQHRSDQVVTVVTDDGRSAAPRTSGGGRGLAGLGQRLALFGGSVTSGAGEHGWRLEARIPAGGRR